MTPKQIAGIIARSALAQLKVAAERGVTLDVNSCEDIAIAIGNGAAQNLAAMQWDESDVTVDASGVDWAEHAEKLNAAQRVRRPITIEFTVSPSNPDRFAEVALAPGKKAAS